MGVAGDYTTRLSDYRCIPDTSSAAPRSGASAIRCPMREEHRTAPYAFACMRTRPPASTPMLTLCLCDKDIPNEGRRI